MNHAELRTLAADLRRWNARNEASRREYDLLPIAFAGHHPLCAWPRCHTHARGPRQRYCPQHIAARRKLNAVADQHPSTDYRAGSNA